MKTTTPTTSPLIKPRHARRVEALSGGLLETALQHAPAALARAYDELDAAARLGRVPALLLRDAHRGRYLAVVDLVDLLALIRGE